MRMVLAASVRLASRAVSLYASPALAVSLGFSLGCLSTLLLPSLQRQRKGTRTQTHRGRKRQTTTGTHTHVHTHTHIDTHRHRHRHTHIKDCNTHTYAHTLTHNDTHTHTYAHTHAHPCQKRTCNHEEREVECRIEGGVPSIYQQHLHVGTHTTCPHT